MSVLNMDIDDELYEKVKTEAKRLDISISAFVRMMLQAWFEGVKFQPSDKK